MMFNNDFLNKRKLSQQSPARPTKRRTYSFSPRDDAGYFRVRTNSKNKLSVPGLGAVVNMTSLQPSDSGEEN